jgi:hypothetical protein
MTVATLFVANGDFNLQQESEPSVCLASLELPENRRAIVTMHSEPEAELPSIVARVVNDSIANAKRMGVQLPPSAYGYYLGQSPQGWRLIVGARIFDR